MSIQELKHFAFSYIDKNIIKYDLYRYGNVTVDLIREKIRKNIISSLLNEHVSKNFIQHKIRMMTINCSQYPYYCKSRESTSEYKWFSTKNDVEFYKKGYNVYPKQWFNLKELNDIHPYRISSNYIWINFMKK